MGEVGVLLRELVQAALRRPTKVHHASCALSLKFGIAKSGKLLVDLNAVVINMLDILAHAVEVSGVLTKLLSIGSIHLGRTSSIDDRIELLDKLHIALLDRRRVSAMIHPRPQAIDFAAEALANLELVLKDLPNLSL